MYNRPTLTVIGVLGALLYFVVLGATVLGALLKWYNPASIEALPAGLLIGTLLFIGGGMIEYANLPDRPIGQLVLALTLVALGGLFIIAILVALSLGHGTLSIGA